MAKFDFASEQASAQWLTKILTDNGYLEQGEVLKVTQNTAVADAVASAKIYTLALEYSQTSTGARPNNFLMKVAKSGSVQDFDAKAERYTAWLLLPQTHRDATLRKEPVFYELARHSDVALPLIPCFGTETDDNNSATCLLLEDYAETHTQPPWPIPPSQRDCEHTIDALAQHHAHWWDNQYFGDGDFPIVGAGQIDEIVGVYEKSYREFAELLGDRLSDARRAVYDRALAQLPRLLKSRFSESTKLTLSHGDAHHWNMLVPCEGSEVVIFDWQTWHVDVATHDLAYMMGALWFSEQRGRQEVPLLQRYHRGLNDRGVDYTWDELTADYQLCAVRHLFTPVIFSSFILPAVWWPQLDRVFCTFDDWQGMELLS